MYDDFTPLTALIISSVFFVVFLVLVYVMKRWYSDEIEMIWGEVVE